MIVCRKLSWFFRRASTLILVAFVWSLGVFDARAQTSTVHFVLGTVTVSEAAGSATIEVVREGSLSGESRVNYSTSNDQAKAGEDYVSSSGTLIFGVGESIKSFSVPIIEDDLDEIDEAVALRLSDPQNCSLGSPITATLRITDNDDPPILTISDGSAVEGNVIRFTLRLNRPTGRSFAYVEYYTENITATAQSYFPAEGGLYFYAPSTEQTVTVQTRSNTTYDGNRTFRLLVRNAIDVNVIGAVGIGTIIDDDSPPPITSTLELPNAVAGEEYASDPPSETENLTYTVASGAVPPGMTLLITGVLTGQATQPGTYTFTIHGTDASGALRMIITTTLVVAPAVVLPSISVNDISYTELNSGKQNAVFTITLSNPSNQVVTVQYATANGSAIAGRDYVAASGTLSFEPGSLSKTVNVQISGDRRTETNETFTLTLSNPVNATIDKPTGTCTIINDDGIPRISILNEEGREGNAGTSMMRFEVRLSKPRTTSVSVNYETVDGSATAGSDYEATSGVLSFAPGEKKKVIDVPIYGDITYEDNEEFTVVLSDPVNGIIKDGTGRGRIHDDDGLPRVTLSDAVGAEGNAGSNAMVFSVTLSHPSSKVVTVDYATEDASATAPVDYSAGSGTLTFNPGEIRKSISVDVHGDQIAEADEYFRVKFRKVTGGVSADRHGTGTIPDDDTPAVLAMFDNLIGFAQALPASAFKNPPATKQRQLVEAIKDARGLLARGNPTSALNSLQSIINQASGTTYFGDASVRQSFVSNATSLIGFLEEPRTHLARCSSEVGEELMVGELDMNQATVGPVEFALRQNYPNPFNPSTTVRFDLAEPAFVSLKIYNLAGELVATPVEGTRSAGTHSIQWNARHLPSGIYIYRLQAGEYVATKRMTLVK